MIKAKERPLESTSPLEKNGVAEPMKNVTVGECKTGKKKKQISKALENASLEKKTKDQKPRKMLPLESEKKWGWNLKKSDDGKDIIKKN